MSDKAFHNQLIIKRLQTAEFSLRNFGKKRVRDFRRVGNFIANWKFGGTNGQLFSIVPSNVNPDSENLPSLPVMSPP